MSDQFNFYWTKFIPIPIPILPGRRRSSVLEVPENTLILYSLCLIPPWQGGVRLCSCDRENQIPIPIPVASPGHAAAGTSCPVTELPLAPAAAATAGEERWSEIHAPVGELRSRGFCPARSPDVAFYERPSTAAPAGDPLERSRRRRVSVH